MVQLMKSRSAHHFRKAPVAMQGEAHHVFRWMAQPRGLTVTVR